MCNINRALRHLLIAVGAGDNDSLEHIKDLYSNRHATKDDYMKALQLYQKYLGEIKMHRGIKPRQLMSGIVIISINWIMA